MGEWCVRLLLNIRSFSSVYSPPVYKTPLLTLVFLFGVGEKK